MAIDWWNVAGKAADWYLKDKQAGDVQDNLLGGIKGARQDIKEYAEPYQETAKWGMEGYKQEGPFDFTHEGYLQSPEYQWLQDQATQQVERSAAAGPTGLYSGQTLADIQDRGHMVAAQEYGAEHARQLAGQKAREDYWWRPAQTGATLAGDTGQALADLALERGGVRAKYESMEDNILHDFIQGALGGQGDPTSVMGTVKDIYESLGGEGELGQSVTDFAKDLLDPGMLGEMGGEVGTYLGSLPGIAQLVGSAGTGLSAVGPGSQAAMLAAQNMGLEGATGATVEALRAGTGYATTGATEALKGMGTKALNFLSSSAGMGVTAAVATLVMGGDLKDAAVSGGAAYAGAALGTAIFPGIGTMIGGALGGMLGSLALGDGVAKTDSAMMVSQSSEGFKNDVYAEGPWGFIGFKGDATRHLDSVSKGYQESFNFIAKTDAIVSNALTPEENEAIKAAMGDQYTYRQESNEGKISGKKVVRSSIKDRAELIKKTIGDDRWNELQLYDFYSEMYKTVKGGDPLPEKYA